VVAVVNLIYSARRGPIAAANPWRSRSPEFMIPSPAPLHNYDQPVVVVGEPYAYGTDYAYVSIDPDRKVELSGAAVEPPVEDKGEAAAAPAGASD